MFEKYLVGFSHMSGSQGSNTSSKRWKQAMYHSVFADDTTYETVMDIIFKEGHSYFHSKRLQVFEDRKKESAYRNLYHRLKKKASFFDIQEDYLVFRYFGPPPWTFVDSHSQQILDSPPRIVFRVVKPSLVDEILKESFYYLEDSGMTGYQNMYYHLVAVKKLLGITQRRILRFLKENPYHLLARTVPRKPELVASFTPESPLYHFQLDVTELRIPKELPKDPREPVDSNPHEFYLCVVVDIFSRYCWIRHIEEETREKVLGHVLDIFSQGDIPKRLQTDNGPQMDQTFTEYVRRFGVEHVKGSPYRPQTNGFVEQKHFTIKTRLYSHFTRMKEEAKENGSTHLVQKFRKDLPLLVSKVQFAVNTGIIKSINMSPVNVHRGFHHGADWSKQCMDLRAAKLVEDLGSQSREISQVFPKVRLEHIRALTEQRASEIQEKRAYRLYDRVKLGLLYEGEEGYQQLVPVYPWTLKIVERAIFPAKAGSLQPKKFVDKSSKVFSWSMSNFMIHDIDNSGRQTKYYLRDSNNRPIQRKVRSRPEEYESHFYGWMFTSFGS